MKTTIMGIDQSYNSTGYCILKGNTIVEVGIIKSNKDDDIYTRALAIATQLVEKVKQHNITTVKMEGLAFSGFGNATRDLAGLLFTIVTQLRQHNPNISIEIVQPTSLKKMATGNGKATKKDMMASVPIEALSTITSSGYKASTGMADLVDAYWLATYR